MSVPRYTPAPLARPRPIRGWAALAGALSFGAAGAVAGYTGVMQTEYQATSRDQAILTGLAAGMLGMFLGLVVGGLVDGLRWWQWRRGRPPGR